MDAAARGVQDPMPAVGEAAVPGQSAGRPQPLCGRLWQPAHRRCAGAAINDNKKKTILKRIKIEKEKIKGRKKKRKKKGKQKTQKKVLD